MNNEYVKTEALIKLVDAVTKAGEDITNSLDGIDERLRRIDIAIDTHTEETRMLDVKRRNNQ
tara:strand:- start:5507 stop:5692 length:186 start_codon:yes stop_codon:yes gene_type:complete